MTIKEAILEALKSDKRTFTCKEICEYIDKNRLIKWKSQTPKNTVSAIIGNFIRDGDARVKCVEIGGRNHYYWAKYENELNLDQVKTTSPKDSKNSYEEKDLHKLLSSYLKTQNVDSKTISHERSNKSDKTQKWTHPDMVGVDFLNLKNESKELLSLVDKSKMFNLRSYELKRTIKRDDELKEGFFQTVSNSSWANYGYLVALEIDADLSEEMKRLNQAFGIGIIALKANPFESAILFQPKYKELDFTTIAKLCNNNEGFKQFIEYINEILSDKKYAKEKFEGFSDEYFAATSDEEIKKYCEEKKIPHDFDADEDSA